MLSTIGNCIAVVLFIASILGLIELPAQCKKWKSLTVDRMGLSGKIGPMTLAVTGFFIMVMANFPIVKDVIIGIFDTDSEVPQGYLQIAKITTTKGYTSIGKGKQFAINVYSSNPGPGRIFKGAMYAQSYILRDSGDSDKEAGRLFRKALEKVEQDYKDGKMPIREYLGKNDGLFTTSSTDIITDPKKQDSY